MASKKIRTILIGSESKNTNFGKAGCSHSMYGGGYDNFIYGIKGLIAIQVYHGWGEYYHKTFKSLNNS